MTDKIYILAFERDKPVNVSKIAAVMEKIPAHYVSTIKQERDCDILMYHPDDDEAYPSEITFVCGV